MVEKVSRFIFCLIFVGGLAGWSSLESEDRETLLRDYKESDFTHPDSRYFRKAEMAGQKKLIRRPSQGVSSRSYLTTQRQKLFFRPRPLESKVVEDSSHSGSTQAKDSSHSGSTQSGSLLPRVFNCKNDGNEFKCRVCNCYYESRGESRKGQLLVSSSLDTRILLSDKYGYPNTICQNVHREYQGVCAYSWVCEGQVEKTLKLSALHNSGCYESSLTSLKSNLKWGFTHYHTASVMPYWSKNRNCGGRKQVGSHIFYRWCDGIRIPQGIDMFESTVVLRTPEVDMYEFIYFGKIWNFLSVPYAMAFKGDSPKKKLKEKKNLGTQYGGLHVKKPRKVIDFLRRNPHFKLKSVFASKVLKMFKFLKGEHPAIQRGDFNGDGIKDYVLLGMRRDIAYMVFINSKVHGDYSEVYKKISSLNGEYLSQVDQGSVYRMPASLKTRELVQLEVYLGKTRSFFVDKNKVHKFNGELKP